MMALHESTAAILPVERSHVRETSPSGHKQTNRLYPSLPSSDFCVVDRSVEENLRPAADSPPDSHRQSDAAAAASAEVCMRARILILEEQKQQLLSINEKWAKEYRTMRQYFKDKTFDADVHSKLVKAEMEVKELQEQNSTLTRRAQHQQEEIRRLNKALEESLQKTEPRETLEQVWKHQAEVFKEDFLKERKDREKMKEKFLDLEKKFRKAHSELHLLKSQVTRTPQPVCECSYKPQGRCSNWEIRQINPNHMVLQRRSTPQDKV